MTSTTAFAPLLAAVLDDTMEVSLSPAGNSYDDEVLIDYDDYATAPFTEDEPMVEDGEPIRPGTATDHMMEDAEPRSEVNEEMMHDDPVAPDTYIEDEELIDYSDDEYQDDTQIVLDDAAVPIIEEVENRSAALIPNVTHSQPVDEAVPLLPVGAAVVEEPTSNFLSAVAENDALDADADNETALAAAPLDDDQAFNTDHHDAVDELSRQVDAEEAEEAAAQELGVQAFKADEPDSYATEADEVVAQSTSTSDRQQHDDETRELKAPPKFPSGLDTTAYFAPDGPQTPSDTGIHPITIRYGDLVMPLFKSRAQSDGLLKDDNLASVSLGDLLDNCRQRLALKVGESISADQELVLSFENMGLQLVEHSPHAFGTSLDDVLGVYLKLHRNDATHAIPPLALSLSLQLKFTSSFNILKAAAEQGEGMSKFAFLRGGADELDEYDQEDEEDEEKDAQHEEYQDGENDGEEYRDDENDGEEHPCEGEGAFADDQAEGEVSQHLEEGQEYEEHQYPENQDEDPEYNADQAEDAPQDDTNYEEYEEHEEQQQQTGPDAGLENYRDEVELPGADADENDDLPNDDSLEYEPDQSDEHAAQESEEQVRPESAASSTTVRGDPPNDSIDLHEDDGNGKSSAPVSEHDAEGTPDGTSADDNERPVGGNSTSEAFALASDSGGLDNQQAIDDLDGEVADENTAPHEAQAESGNNVDQHKREDDPPAVAEDLNDDLNDDDLPAEEDEQLDGEQLDAAFDLLEGHDFERPAENGESAQPADSLEFDDDDIGFNDDVEEAVPTPNSPLGKRSFDEHVGQDDVPEEQEPKKARS